MNIRYSQNFITSKNHIEKIMNQVEIEKRDYVIEIGSGKGHFTKELAKRCDFVTAVEIDPKMCEKTEARLDNQENYKIINEDILKYKFPNQVSYKIFGNIPFGISTDIVRKIAFESNANVCFLIVEYGFAKRLLDMKKSLSLMIQSEMKIRALMKVPRGYFHPEPKIDGMLISLKRKESRIAPKERKAYGNFVSKWVKGEYKKLFTKNQFKRAIRYANIEDLNKIEYDQFLSLFKSYMLFNN